MISATNEATWTVVISKGQSRNPQKRDLEQRIAEAAHHLDGVNVLVIPHLYDLPKASDSFKKLVDVEGDVVVVSWIYPRAAHWVLDRNGIRGQRGEVRLGAESDPEDEPASAPTDEDPVDRVTDLFPRPNRNIHCIDLKSAQDPEAFIHEIRRIVDAPDPASNDTHRGRAATNGSAGLPIVGGTLVEVEEPSSRRWYPVIDYDRCTNCMECVDFCLFGVYGVDSGENILVEQPDNCRKGCPACSRVCPENAIIFPQHKAPAIAGAQIEGDEGFKIDLSQLFGAPAGGDDPIATAARERDEQLLLAGREAVGIDDQLKKRQSDLSRNPRDKLDDLLDSLEAFDL
jgi:NAD-dependent dihydropyrimidine dehydrogenase PreA subunit